MLKEVDGDVW